MIRLFCKEEEFVHYVIKDNFVSVRINTETDKGFVFYDETIIPCFNKDVLISGIIKANYPSDIMDAVRNNYELVRDGTAGDKTEEYTEEYNKMQAWRAYSKQLASEIINSKSNNI